jgi:CubicO group peptidase (beta-lactamase class C family)
LSLETLEDESALLERLEREPLRWAPGDQQGYHGVTFGLYAGALFKKITQRSIGDFIRQEIAQPLNLDLYLGLTDDEERDLADRLCPIFTNQPRDIVLGVLPELLFKPTVEGRFYRRAIRRGSDTALAFGQPAALGARGLKNFNTARVRRLELPWSNIQASARAISSLYNALLTPGRLVSAEALARITPVQSWTESDAVLGKPLGFTLGFMKEETRLFSPLTSSFGHPGAGGALGWADPDNQLTIGYLMNRMGYHVRSPRALALCHAIYRCLDEGDPLS